MIRDRPLRSVGPCSGAATQRGEQPPRRSPGRLVLDAGSKVLGADQPAWATGAGRLLDHPDARIVALSEHHATVVLDDDPTGQPALGDVVRVVPNHVCSAVNLADSLAVASGGRLVDHWAVVARGANT